MKFRSSHSKFHVLRDLPLQHLWIVYPGSDRYRLDEVVTVLPVAAIHEIATGRFGSASESIASSSTGAT